MIERLWQLGVELWSFLVEHYDPVTDTIDILLITAGIYWLLLLIRGTRAVQIIIGLLVLIGASLASELVQLATVDWILDNFLSSAVLIIIVLFQHDIRRALARMGRGVFPSVAQRETALAVEEIVRAAQTLAQKRVGALVVIERETALGDLVEQGVPLDAAVTKELLTSIFLPYSPLHDGAVLIEEGRVAYAGCILPLTLRQDLPEGVGTRHRAAVGITEETDAVVVVVSEETGTISVVHGGEMMRDLDGPRLRVALRDLLSGTRRAPAPPAEERPAEPAPAAAQAEAGPSEASAEASSGAMGAGSSR